MEHGNKYDKLEKISLKLREAEVTPNKYRNEVLYYLDTFKNHPTANEIFKHMKQHFPYISLATVYNTLNTFLEKHLVIALKPDGNTVHYDSTITDHCHFICETCGGLSDLNEFNATGGRQRRRIKGNLIRRIVTYVFGICADCAGQS